MSAKHKKMVQELIDEAMATVGSSPKWNELEEALAESDAADRKTNQEARDKAHALQVQGLEKRIRDAHAERDKLQQQVKGHAETIAALNKAGSRKDEQIAAFQERDAARAKAARAVQSEQQPEVAAPV